MAVEDCKPWKLKILHDLQERNRRQCDTFANLIKSHNKLLESSEGYRAINSRLSVEVQKLKSENQELKEQLSSGVGGGGGDNGSRVRSEGTYVVEQKLCKALEELTELHRKKGENAQQLIDLSNTLKDREKQIATQDAKIRELEAKISELNGVCQNLEHSLHEAKTANQCLADEQQALQLAYVSLESKMRPLQEQNQELESRWMQLKAQEAAMMNEENETFYKQKQQKVKEELARAADEPIIVDVPSRRSISEAACCFVISVPTRALQTVEAHEGEVNAVRWSPSGRFFATGGSDRKLKLWEVHGGKIDSKAILIGSNAGVTSIDFEDEETMVLAASNDFACRVWTWSDQRQRHTLTGHSGKVLAAKFLGDGSRVVSGSHDRTLKLWDLRSKACIKTNFAGSSCNDIVTLDATNVISGHFDKKIRFWDTRSDISDRREIVVSSKVTSLDLTPDRNCLLACTRDDCIALVDLRANQTRLTLSAEGFRVATDWTRAVFSPDGEYVAAGSVDGGVYTWKTSTGKLETVLREHKEAVMACSWNPNGKSLVSCDRHKNVVYWSDF